MSEPANPQIKDTKVNFQAKYQKAIKEISKLVTLNTTLKKQINHLRNVHETLEDKYNTVSADYENLEKKYNDSKKSQFSCQESKKQSIHMSCKVNVDQWKDGEKDLEQTGTMSEFMDIKKKFVQSESKITEQQNIINSLTLQIQQSAVLNENLKENCNNINNMLEKSKIQLEREKAESRILNDWVEKLNLECQELKKKIVFYEGLSNNSINKKQMIFSSKTDEKEGYQKILSLKAENKQLKQKYRVKKEKYNRQIGVLTEENRKLGEKLNALKNFMDKQQQYIQKFSRGSRFDI